jgi:hypothetical protein
MIQLATTDYGLKHTRITVQVGLVAAIILSLSAAQACQRLTCPFETDDVQMTSSSSSSLKGSSPSYMEESMLEKYIRLLLLSPHHYHRTFSSPDASTNNT